MFVLLKANKYRLSDKSYKLYLSSKIFVTIFMVISNVVLMIHLISVLWIQYHFFPMPYSAILTFCLLCSFFIFYAFIGFLKDWAEEIENRFDFNLKTETKKTA